MRARTMVYLEPGQKDALKKKARREHLSVAELIRRAVDRYLKPESASPRVRREAYEKLVGIFSSGLTDVSERHDHYIGEALYRDHIEHSD